VAYKEFNAWLRKTWPNPPDSVLARLRHTLDVYDSALLDAVPDDERFVTLATVGVYRDKDGHVVSTGITWGDLRKIRTYLEHQWKEEADRPMKEILDIPLHNFGPEPRPVIR